MKKIIKYFIFLAIITYGVIIGPQVFADQSNSPSSSTINYQYVQRNDFNPVASGSRDNFTAGAYQQISGTLGTNYNFLKQNANSSIYIRRIWQQYTTSMLNQYTGSWKLSLDFYFDKDFSWNPSWFQRNRNITEFYLVKSGQLYNITDGQIYWEDLGDYPCVMNNSNVCLTNQRRHLRANIYFNTAITGTSIIVVIGPYDTNLQYAFGAHTNTTYGDKTSESFHFTLYSAVLYHFEQQNNDYTGMISEQVKGNALVSETNSAVRESNSILGRIRDFIENIKDTTQSILQNMGQSVSGFVETIKNTTQNIFNFFTNEILGLDDIDDVLDEFMSTGDNSTLSSFTHNVIFAPINLLNSLKTGTYCVNINTTMYDKQITIPSGCIFWQRNDVEDFRYIWNMLFGGFLIYKFAMKLVKVINNSIDPTKDDIGGLEV